MKYDKLNKKTYWYVKRFFDIIISLILLIISSPFLIIVVIITLINLGLPLHNEKRMREGLYKQPFVMYKIRTKKLNSDNLIHKERYTKISKIIDWTHLNEIPQLINILKGDMSFIGPRPWPPSYTNLFTAEQRKRNDVLPGITGWAQVHGRNNISVLERIEYDLEYVNKISFIMDIKVIFKTIATVFSEAGAEITKQGIKRDLEILNENRIKVEGK